MTLLPVLIASDVVSFKQMPPTVSQKSNMDHGIQTFYLTTQTVTDDTDREEKMHIFIANLQPNDTATKIYCNL